MAVGFLTAQLGSNGKIKVEVAWGANLAFDASNWSWTDITADVRQADGQRIVINPMGHSDWLAQAQPAECTFELDNTSGAYSKGPMSSNYPFVRRSTPIRASVSLNNITYFTRFLGYVYSWKPWWDTSGNLAVVTVKAAGKLRQLQQGEVKPLRSPLTRSILNTTSATLRQYWPGEDGQLSSVVASALSAGTPMTITGQPNFASFIPANVDAIAAFHVPYGTEPLMSFKSGGTATATFPAGSASAWTVQIGGYANPFSTATTVVLAEWSTPGGSYVRWQLISDSTIATGGTRVIGIDSSGTQTTLASSAFTSGAWGDYRVQASQSGGNIALTLKFSLDTVNATLTTKTLAGIAGMILNPTGSSYAFDVVTSHVRIWDGTTAPDFQVSGSNLPASGANPAWFSYLGELATDRLTRLFTEEGGNGLPLVIVGTTTTTMGPQGVDTFLNLVRECEAADQGLLFDGLTQAFTYVTRSARYNQSTALTLDASAGQVGDPFTPEDDDQINRNLATVNRKNGSNATFEDSTGPLGTAAIGTFESTPGSDLNLDTDAPLLNIAAWMVHVGTVDEPYRYPTLSIDLAAASSLASAWLNTTPCERIDVTNISSRATQHPPGTVSIILEGYSEELSPFDWIVNANCSPYRPWEVFQIQDSRLGRIETDGSTLNSSATTGATSLSVASSGGLWDTGSAPFDIDLEGEQVTVTAVTGSSSPQTFTVTRSVNGVVKAHNSAAVVKLWRPGVLAL